MSWCPRCRGEFSDEDASCPQCDGELLKNVPDEDSLIMDVVWVPIARDVDPVRAQLLKDMLESSGVPTVITGASLSAFHIYPNVENAVMVPRRWMNDAIEIVRDFNDRVDTDEVTVCSSCGAEVPADAEACPACGAPFDQSED